MGVHRSHGGDPACIWRAMMLVDTSTSIPLGPKTPLITRLAHVTGITHFCLESDDIDGFIATLAAKGIVCTPRILGGDHAWQTWVQDPDGNRFEIHQYTAHSMQQHGRVAEIT